MSICLPSTTIKWYCAFWLKRATQQHSIDCSHSVRVGLSHMMVMRGRGKEGWWQSWHGERDTHCTLRWRKRRRAAPLHHIPLSKHRRGEREGSQDVRRKKNCQENVYNRPASSSSFFLSSSWVSVWFHRRAPYRSTSRVLCALLGAGVRRPTTGRRKRRGAARCFLPLDGSEPCCSHLCVRTPSLQKSPLLFLEELGLCPLLQFYRWVFVFTTWCLFSPVLSDGMRAYVWWAFRISQPHAWK